MFLHMLPFPNCQVIFGPFRGGERGGGQPGALDDLPGANFDGDDDAGEDEGPLRVRTGYERGAVDPVVADNSEAEGMSSLWPRNCLAVTSESTLKVSYLLQKLFTWPPLREQTSGRSATTAVSANPVSISPPYPATVCWRP